MNLAIIIPTYDNLPMLKTLVKQIYKYTKKFNLYIIEDGQKKETIKYLSKFNKTIFHKKNEGVAKSWNEGLKAALKDKCTHFAIMNDDIELPPKWWEICQKEFPNAHLVTLRSRRFPMAIMLAGWFFILDRTAIDKVGFFDEQFSPYFAEDTDYAIRYYESGLKYAVVDLKIIHHGGVTTYGKIKKNNSEKFRQIWNDNWMKLTKKYPRIRMQSNLR